MNLKAVISAVALSALAGGAMATSFEDKVNAALNAYEGDVSALVTHQENLENERLNHILNGGIIQALDAYGNVYDVGYYEDLKDDHIADIFNGVDYVEAWVWNPGWQYDGSWTYNTNYRWDIDLDSFATYGDYTAAEFFGTGTNVVEAILDLSENVFEAGFDDGYEIGFQEGYEQGYADGYIDGYGDGLAAQ